MRALLRLRNLLPRTLEALARDAKWSSAEVRVQIASHNNAPHALVERLATGLPPDAQRRLLQSPGLSPSLRLKLAGRGPAR
jgi:hypothetical protein